MKIIHYIGSLVATGLLSLSVCSADVSSDIERALMYSPETSVELESFVTEDPQVQWALETAKKYQNSQDWDLRNKFLSLSLVLLERQETTKFVQEVASGPRASESSRRFQFQRLYGDGGTYGTEEVQSQITDAVQKEVDGEGWFISILEKLGVLTENYKELNDKLRLQYPNLSRAELADILIKQAARLTAGVGFATNLPGAIPGVGPAASMALSVGGMVPDMIYLFKQQATLIFRIADLYGKDMKEAERVTEALILFGVASGVSAATKAIEQYTEKAFTVYVQSKVTEEAVQSTVAKLAAMHPLLRDIITTLVSKEMITQAGVEKAANSLIPLVGAGISGAMNYVFTRQVGNVAKAFYGDDSADRLQTINNLQMPKVELAMFRSLVSVILADGVKKPEEVLAIQKILGRFEHHRSTVEKMLDGDQNLLDRTDYDIASESVQVKEHILYAVVSMQFVDNERHPAEVELHEKILSKFQISETLAKEVESRVREERSISSEADAGILSKVYRQYQKAIGAREEVEF